MKKLLLVTACAAMLSAGFARAQGAPAGSDARSDAAVQSGVRRSTWPAEVSPSSVPRAKDMSSWRDACKDDIGKLCPQKYSQEDILACLDKNADRLSPDCRAAQQNAKGANQRP